MPESVGAPGAGLRDAHRHLGRLPAFPFYGGPPVNPDTTARASIDELLMDLDAEGVERALVMPNYGVPIPELAFSLNPLVIEAAAKDDRVRAALWVSPKPDDLALTRKALESAGEAGVRALKISFLLGGAPDEEATRPALDEIFAAARAHNLVVHVHTSPGSTSDISRVATLVERYADDVALHLVHFGGGMSGHIKLVGGLFFDWIAAGKRVYTDLSWAIGFTPRWLAEEIDKRGIGADRVLFASDQPWGDLPGEYAKLRAVVADGELARAVFRDNFDRLYF